MLWSAISNTVWEVSSPLMRCSTLRPRGPTSILCFGPGSLGLFALTLPYVTELFGAHPNSSQIHSFLTRLRPLHSIPYSSFESTSCPSINPISSSVCTPTSSKTPSPKPPPTLRPLETSSRPSVSSLLPFSPMLGAPRLPMPSLSLRESTPTPSRMPTISQAAMLISKRGEQAQPATLLLRPRRSSQLTPSRRPSLLRLVALGLDTVRLPSTASVLLPLQPEPLERIT